VLNKVLIVFTDSEDTARTLSEIVKQYELPSRVIGSAVLVFAQKGEDLLELLLDMDKDMLKSFRYLLKDVDDNTKIDAFYLLREVPNTVSIEKLADRLIYTVISDIFYDVKTFFHPIIDLKTGKVFAYEALCRPPLKITDLLSIGKSTSTYTEDFCRTKAIKSASEKLKGNTKLFVNFHPRFLIDPFIVFGDFISTALSYNLKPSRIVIELTEYEELKLSVIKNFISFLKEEGVQVALDDIGSGYSGLFYLSELKPDYIKIDMELIRDIHKNNFKKVIVNHLIQIAHTENIKVVCEGVEKKEELEWVRYTGADYAQGFLFAKPSPDPNPYLVEEIAKTLIET